MIKNIMEKIIKFIKKIKNKKGFTLVELLAVIVLLAGISVISIPTVIGNMTKAKEKAFNTVGETMVKYLESNYEACKLGDGTIVKYDEDIFDSNCELKNENLTDLSKNLINNSGYNIIDIEKVDIIELEKGKFKVILYPTATGKFSNFMNYNEEVIHNAHCWDVESLGSNNYKLVKFNGINHETGDIIKDCGVSKDKDGLYSITIPSNVEGKKITTLDNELFSVIDKDSTDDNLKIKKFINIKEININEGITTIEDSDIDIDFINSFGDLENNSGYSIKDIKGSFMGIGYNTNFSGNIGNVDDLEKIFEDRILTVNLPDSLKYIGNGAFFGTAIDKISIPKNVEFIGDWAFTLSANLERVTFENNSNLKSIGDYAFFLSTQKEIIIPKSVENIGNGSFLWNVLLEKLTFEEDSNLKTIGEFAFGANKISELVIPKSVEQIKEGAFDQSTNLSQLTFEGANTNQSSLILIGKNAFYNASLNYDEESLILPSTIKEIGDDAFKVSVNKSNNLKNIKFMGNRTQLNNIGNKWYDINVTSVLPNSED